MAERTLMARVGGDGAKSPLLLVTSPAVGLADLALRPGVFLNRYDRLLNLLVLGRRHVVRLPRDVQGWVVETFVGNELTPVAYGTPLLRLDPRTAGGPGMGEPGRGGDRETAGGADDASGSIVVKAPTEGIFYRKASPDSPPFVALGTIVTTGTVLGMVEVMKCFNQIAYGGPGLPESGEVTGILVEDAAEVQFGQPLFRIKPSIA